MRSGKVLKKHDRLRCVMSAADAAKHDLPVG
jgi:hypothetical protein